MTNLLIIFIILNIVNVIIQTFKSIATVKCGKAAAAIVNAVAYGLYTIVLVYTNCELGLWAKVAVVAVTNLIGVYVVKWAEEKMRKDRLWKIECTVKNQGNAVHRLDHLLTIDEISHNFFDIGNYTIFNCYSKTQNESIKIKKDIEAVGAKYFASETKLL